MELRLQTERHEVDGQRELEERGAELGSTDEGFLSDVRVWHKADQLHHRCDFRYGAVEFDKLYAEVVAIYERPPRAI